MKFSLLPLLYLLFISLSVFSQDACHKSTEGTDFWFGFMENRWYYRGAPNNPHYVAITVTAREETDFTIRYGPNETLFTNYHVNANSSTPPIVLEQDQQNISTYEARGTQTTENKGIHITAQKPINVYAFNYGEKSSDVAVIYPLSSLGTEYYTMCYFPNVSGSLTSGTGRNSEFLIVGTVDNTRIDIKPTKVIDGTIKRPANETYTIYLNKGQTYQAQSENTANAAGEGDLTGTYIKSNNPIAVYSGSLATTIPKVSTIPNVTISAWDHLYEQMPPVNSLGHEYYTVPLKGGLVDRYRILAAESGETLVNIEGIGDILLQKGGIYEFTKTKDQPSRIYSNQKILVAQYSQSLSEDQSYNQAKGDPFMIILSDITQTVNDVTFVAFESTVIVDAYVNILARTDQIPNLLMDENPSFQSSFIPYSNGLYSYAQIKIPKGSTHRLRNIDPNQGLLATVYGFGNVESFGYGVGFNLDIHIGLRHDTLINGRKIIRPCSVDEAVILDAGNEFEKYSWSRSSSDTLSSITVKGNGSYSVTASLGQCVAVDTVEILVQSPVLTLGNDTVICNPDILQLDVGLGWKNILWSTGESTQTIIPKGSDTYSVQVIDRRDCPANGSIKVTFDDPPVFNIWNPDTLICGSKTKIIDLTADKGQYTLERTDNGEVYPGVEAVVPVFGTFPFKFTATDQYGCFRDTTFKLGFHKIPTVDFSIDSTKCHHYNLAVNYIGDATVNAARFTWVFGGDTIADGIGITSDTIPLGINKNKRDLSLRVLEQGCSNADTIKDIKVIPNLSFQIVDSLGCQPFNAEFLANNTETVFYDWNYGDGIFERADKHAFHVYRDDGYYTVNLKVTTDKGCTNSITVDSMLYVAPIPTAGFDIDPSRCLDLNNHDVSYLGTGNNKAVYYWDLTAFDAEEIINNPGTTKGPFTFKLKNKPRAPIALSVISEYGCRSDTATIQVKRIPSFSMSVENNKGCIPLETGFNGIQTDAVDKISYTWDFGDGTTGMGDKTSHIYELPDKWYDINLNAYSSLTQCEDNLLIDSLIAVYPRPDAEFSLDHSIVYNDKPDVHLVNQSTGAVSYLWDFGDGTTSLEENASHKYQVMGYQKVLLEAFNEYACSDTISHDVLVAFARIFPPNAFSPNSPNIVDREFKLSQIAIKEEGYHLLIMSRWNDLVFETKNEIKGWDGRMKNGDYAPAGNYVWVLDFIDFLGRAHHQTGTVTLVY